MRTVCGWGRWAQRRLGRSARPAAGIAQVRPLAAGRRPLVTDVLGEQRRGGARLDQVDGTTCGSAVLVAMAAWADPAELDRYEGAAAVGVPSGRGTGFGARYDARQKEVHRQSTRVWPRVLGTSPWGMVAWLRRHASGAGPYRVRLVDDTDAADVADAVREAGVALAAGRPVPLLVGPLLPRHYCMAVSAQGDGWRVYEPTSGQVRHLDPDLVRRRALAPVLGFGRLHAVLLPA